MSKAMSIMDAFHQLNLNFDEVTAELKKNNNDVQKVKKIFEVRSKEAAENTDEAKAVRLMQNYPEFEFEEIIKAL
jgi:hypothetical protein